MAEKVKTTKNKFDPQPKAEKNFDETNDIKKLLLYVTIVNRGQGNAVVSLFQKCGSSAQFIQLGNGTATKDVYDILGIENNEKDVVLCLIKQELIEDTKKELAAFFAMSKRNRGIGFSIELKSMIGVRLYRFLTDTL